MKTLVYMEVLSDLKDLETLLTALNERELHECDSILIYVDGPQWVHVSTDDLPLADEVAVARKQARERVRNKVIYFAPNPSWLSGRNAHPLKVGRIKPVRVNYENDQAHAFEPLAKVELNDLIEQAMSAAIRDGLARSIVRAPTGAHFELPSQAHASHFIRFSESFDCIDSVQRTAYWIAVSLMASLEGDQSPPDRTFLVDHPSMLLLGTHVNLIYGGSRNVLALKGYPSETALRAAASRLLDGVAGPVTAVIGIASTGKLAGILKELAGDKGVELDFCLAFSAVDIPDGPKPLAHLPLDGYVHSADAASCSMCGPERTKPIKIHSNSFLVSFADVKDIRLPEDYFVKQRQFIDSYGDIDGALRVHFDESNEAFPRHHAYGIDVTKLLDHGGFSAEVHSKLDSLDPKPDWVLIPSHKASALLRATIAKWRDIPVLEVGELDSAKLEVSKNPVVLVFDDKVISGQTMRNLNSELRRTRETLWEKLAHVHFFSPIVTTPSEVDLSSIRKGLTTRHTWTASWHQLYWIPLPTWHKNDECPWCKEQQWLTTLAAESDSFDSPLTIRQGVLSTKEGLGAMHCLAPAPDGYHCPPLAASSVAGDEGSTQLQVLIATASAVQQRRTAVVNPLNPHSLTNPTRMDGFVFENAYTEPLIACSILRALKPDEVSTSMIDFLARVLRAPNTHAGAGAYQVELAIGLLAGKMGTLHDIGSAWEALRAYGVSEESLKGLGFVKTVEPKPAAS